MTLKEKKFVKSFQDEQLPTLQQQIKEALGFDIPMDIEWSTLFEERFMHLYNDTYPKIYFQPLIEGFALVAEDDLGKEALKESLKKIVITNNNNHHNPAHVYSLSDGILTIDHSPVLNADKVEDRVNALVELLENNL